MFCDRRYDNVADVRKAWPLVIGAIVSTARPASAETPLPLELDWEAPRSCPDAGAVRAVIERILRGPLTKPSSVVARGRVEETEDGRFHLSMTVRTGNVEDRRTLDAPSCATLSRGFSIVVALAIDPTQGNDQASDPATPDEPPPVPASPAIPVRARMTSAAKKAAMPPREPHLSAPSNARVAVGVGGWVTRGILPEPIPGLFDSVSLRLGRWRFGALLSRSFRQRAVFEKRAGATFTLVDAGGFGSYLVPLGIFGVGPAANVEATYGRATGFGIRTPSTSSAAWLTVAFGVRAEMHALSWLDFVARIDGLIPIAAPSFALATSDDVLLLHAPEFPQRLSLGAEIVFP